MKHGIAFYDECVPRTTLDEAERRLHEARNWIAYEMTTDLDPGQDEVLGRIDDYFAAHPQKAGR